MVLAKGGQVFLLQAAHSDENRTGFRVYSDNGIRERLILRGRTGLSSVCTRRAIHVPSGVSEACPGAPERDSTLELRFWLWSGTVFPMKAHLQAVLQARVSVPPVRRFLITLLALLVTSALAPAVAASAADGEGMMSVSPTSVTYGSAGSTFHIYVYSQYRRFRTRFSGSAHYSRWLDTADYRGWSRAYQCSEWVCHFIRITTIRYYRLDHSH